MPDRPLRLLDVSIMWPPEYQPFIAGRLRALATAGVDVTVVTAYHGRFDPKLLPFARIIRLPSARESSMYVAVRTAIYSLLALRRPPLIARLARIGWLRSGSIKAFARWWSSAVPLLTAKPDIIHFEWNSQAASSDWLPDLLGVPFVVSCRGRQVNILPYLPGHEKDRNELADTFRRAALVHGVCHDILREAEALGMPAEKGRVVYTSVDVDFFHPIERPDRRPEEPIRLLNVGVSMWRKGYEYLLLALKEALDRGVNVRLDVVDYDGPERDRAEYTISDLGLQGRVNILGKLTPEGVREALRRSDIFVLSALSEGVSNAVIEAMACGIPVITTDCGGMREAVTDGVEGLVVPTRDPSALADAIVQLSRDGQMRAEMGRAGRARVERDFEPSGQAQRFIALYQEALKPRPDLRFERIWSKTVQLDRQPDRPLKIVTVAELDWRNGYEYALDAVRRVVRRGQPVQYTIVGRGPFLEAVGFARREMDLMGEVDIVLDPSQGQAALQRPDLFLLAAVAPGAGHALEEARRAGIPCIRTDAVDSEIGERHDCWIVPRRDSAALADAIMQACAPIDSDLAVSQVQA